MALASINPQRFEGQEPLQKSEQNNNRHNASEKRLNTFHELTEQTLNIVIDTLQIENDIDDTVSRRQTMEQILATLSEILSETKQHLTLMERQKVAEAVLDEIYGFGPLSSLLKDDSVSEVMVNAKDSVYVERNGKLELSEVRFRDDKHILHIIDKIVSPLGRHVDESSPLVDARLPDGSRVNVIIPPLALKGPTITIRKFATDPLTLNDLISFGTLSRDMAMFLRASVIGRMNILVSGGTGSGKTTLLNVLSSFIPHNERIVTIEDAAELQLQQDHVVTLESRPANTEGKGRITIQDLVVNSLRMRPDRIVVGECRGGEALDMLQAMNTGHDGSLTTVHANSPRDSLSRLETLVMMSGMELPSRAIREQVASAIHLVVQVVRLVDGSRKITKISEIMSMEGDTITMQDIFVFRQDRLDEQRHVVGKHVATGIQPSFLDKLERAGARLPASLFSNQN